ncbi:MAG: hypothetical protein K0R51_1667 [Cytophagaceae bacterium]|jgi:uncharacterized membrane protein YfcA|nr:hypothetical protein [Cytophagaceae bacterium]
MPWEAYALLLAAGIIGGYVSGLLGIGGGIIYIFVIPYALHFWNIPEQWHAQVIIANSLAAIFFSSLAANYTHYKKKYYYPRPILIIGLASIVASWFSLKYYINTDLFSMKAFLCCLIVLLLYMLVLTLKGSVVPANQSVQKVPLWGLLLIGLFSGIVAAASGLGGGIVVIPLLNRFFGINIRKAGAISMGVIMLTSLAITLINLNTKIPQMTGMIGLIIPTICIALSVSVLITSPLGVSAAHKLNPRWISLIYAGFLFIIIIDKSIRLLSLFGYTS